MKQPDMFGRPKRKSPRVMAKLIDAGEAPDGTPVCNYLCRKCGWESGWVEERRSVSKVHLGYPCESCNAPTPEHTDTREEVSDDRPD